MNETIKNLAKKANMSEQDVENLYIKTKAGFEGRGIPEDKIEGITFARMQTYLKKKFDTGASGQKVSAMFIGMNNQKDWAIFHREKIDKAIGEQNLSEQKTIELGYKNAEGKYLYQNGNNKGKVIPDESWQAKAYGIIEVKEDARFTTFHLYDDAAKNPLPLCKPCKAVVNIRDSAPAGEYAVSMNASPTEASKDYVNWEIYAPLISKTQESRMISPLKAIDEFAKRMSKSENKDDIFANWAIIKGNVVKFVPARNNSLGVIIDDDSLTLDNEEDEVKTYAIWFDESFDIDLTDDASDVTFVVNTRINRETGKLTLNGMGYWVDTWFRKQEIDAVPDPQQTWG